MANSAARFKTLRDIASRINSDSDLASLLQDLIRLACEHGAWDLGSIMAIDTAGGYTDVMVRHDPSLLRRKLENRWELASSPALTALRRGQPVYIRDATASAEFPGYRRDAIERDYRTVLVLPMACTDANERPMVMGVISRALTEVSDDDLAYMDMIVHLGAIAIDREKRHLAQLAAAEQLRRGLLSQAAMLQEVLAGGSTVSLAAKLNELLGTPVLVLDFFANSVLATASPLPDQYTDDAWRSALDGPLGNEFLQEVRAAIDIAGGRPGTVQMRKLTRLRLDAQVEPLQVDGQPVGAMLCFTSQSPADFQRLMLQSAKFALSVQMMRSVIRFRFESRTLSELFFEIVERRWRDPQDILARARRLGLSLVEPAQMLIVDFPNGPNRSDDQSAGHHQNVERLLRQQDMAGHVISVGSGLVCLLHLGKDAAGQDAQKTTAFARRMSTMLGASFTAEPIVVMGGVCNSLESCATEWERCWRMIRVARTFGRSGVLAAPEFGPLPLLIGAADSADMRSFVEGAIGPLIQHDRNNNTPYLETLAAYVRAGCRGQQCANDMGIHVTTLRYRMARIADLLGIDVDTPDRRFSIELALRLHGLTEEGPALRSPAAKEVARR
ncbi:MAG: PucR family transcriptional regulator [Rhodoferax sp.]|nr:PucR family transcriptional regulator [Rhodoferax sp.]